jgi:hypothetical protein
MWGRGDSRITLKLLLVAYLRRAITWLDRDRVNGKVDGRLMSRLRGYHPVAPRSLRYGPFVHRL